MANEDLRKLKYIQQFVKKDPKTNRSTLVLPMESGQKFVREFLSIYGACSQEEYATRFQRTVFGYKQFHVTVNTLMPASVKVPITARDANEAKTLVSTTKLTREINRGKTYVEVNRKKVAGPLVVSKATLATK